MTDYSHALVYRGSLTYSRSSDPEPAMTSIYDIPLHSIGFWDLSLLLGDLPACITQLAPQLRGFALYTVTAAVPAGLVLPRFGLCAERFLPHALRVTRALKLDSLVALTPFPLANSDSPMLASGPVAIVSYASDFERLRSRRQRARAALRIACPVLPPALSGAIQPLLKQPASGTLS